MAFRSLVGLFKETVVAAYEDDVMSLSAAVAYYATFSMPPLLVVVVALAGAFFGADAVREVLFGEASRIAGPRAVQAMREMIDNAADVGTSVGAKLAGIAALVFGATGAFAQIQAALNKIWRVPEPQRRRAGLIGLVLKRVLSFGMVITIAFLLLVSLAVSAALAALGAVLFGTGASVVVESLNFLVSLGVTTLLFAAVFAVLPDTRVAWRDVWTGAAVTALLFAVGKTLIGLYVGSADPTSAFGAAGSLALILIWIYYSSIIVLIGAEFTWVYAKRRGSRSNGRQHTSA
jgi:membrane protein